jgi:hypothetical protein
MIPNHIPTALEETPQMTVSMYLLGDSDTVASNESEMCNKITELFLNWSAVLSFQAMGHATSILKKKKVKRKLDSPPPPSPYQDQHVVSDIKRKPRRKVCKDFKRLQAIEIFSNLLNL